MIKIELRTRADAKAVYRILDGVANQEPSNEEKYLMTLIDVKFYNSKTIYVSQLTNKDPQKIIQYLAIANCVTQEVTPVSIVFSLEKNNYPEWVKVLVLINPESRNLEIDALSPWAKSMMPKNKDFFCQPNNSDLAKSVVEMILTENQERQLYDFWSEINIEIPYIVWKEIVQKQSD